MYDVVAIGELLIDFTTDAKSPDGYPIMAAHPGGAVANFLAPLAKYGKAAALISKVGNDAFGNMLMSTVEEVGIDVSGVKKTDDAFTTLAFVTRDENGDREFSFARKPGADIMLSAEDIDFNKQYKDIFINLDLNLSTYLFINLNFYLMVQLIDMKEKIDLIKY